MHLIDVLACGVNGAASGTATLTKRGNSTAATWYTDAEKTSTGSTAAVTLDANGGAVVYVDELTTVTVKDTTGATVRTFTAGVAASGVEVISQSFTGADYVTAVAGASEPITLAAALDTWFTSAGAVDFKVEDASGTAVTLQALAGTIPTLYNVKSDTYGAVGDGATNDASAIQAAITAADADTNGGVVYFPPGTYICNSALTTAAAGANGNIRFLGAGSDLSIISCPATVSPILDFARSGHIEGMQLRHTLVHTSGLVFNSSVNGTSHSFVDVIFGHSTAATMSSGKLITLSNTATEINATRCTFNIGTVTSGVGISFGSEGTIDKCNIVIIGALATATMVEVEDRVSINNCTFDASGGVPTHAVLINGARFMSDGCLFTNASSGQYIGFDMGAGSTKARVGTVNGFAFSQLADTTESGTIDEFHCTDISAARIVSSATTGDLSFELTPEQHWYRHQTITAGGGAQTITFANSPATAGVPIGTEFILALNNTTGGNITITWSTNTGEIPGTTVVGANKMHTCKFITSLNQAGSAVVWTQFDYHADATVVGYT